MPDCHKTEYTGTSCYVQFHENNRDSVIPDAFQCFFRCKHQRGKGRRQRHAAAVFHNAVIFIKRDDSIFSSQRFSQNHMSRQNLECPAAQGFTDGQRRSLEVVRGADIQDCVVRNRNAVHRNVILIFQH